MNKSMMMGTLLGAGVATAGGAISSYQYFKEPTHADVLNTVAITETIKTPRKECHDQTVVRQKPVQDENRLAGKAVGAIIGGVLGKQVGDGNGRKAATVVGAIAGGYAGDRVQGNMQRKATYTTTENRCRTVYDTREDIVGYDVTYRLKDQEGKIRMPYNPGSQLPVANGQVVIPPSPRS